MAGRDLAAFVVYRCKKFLRRGQRQQLRPRPTSRDDGGGHREGGEPEGQQFEPQLDLDSSHLMQPGGAGDKTSDWLPEELELEAAREAGRLVKKLVTPISRRRKAGPKRKTLDVRSTIHHNLKNQGNLLELRWRMRKPAKPRVVLLLDTSSSMISASKMMLQFVYALQKELRSIEVFIFGNQLEYVTPILHPDFDVFLNELRQLQQWNFGGTEMWRPLSQLRKGYPHLLTSRTVVIILSDCMLYEKYFALAPLNNLRRRVQRLYLFNPDPRARNLDDHYYQETISRFKTVVDRMYYTETIYEVAEALRKLL